MSKKIRKIPKIYSKEKISGYSGVFGARYVTNRQTCVLSYYMFCKKTGNPMGIDPKTYEDVIDSLFYNYRWYFSKNEMKFISLGKMGRADMTHSYFMWHKPDVFKGIYSAFISPLFSKWLRLNNISRAISKSKSKRRIDVDESKVKFF